MRKKVNQNVFWNKTGLKQIVVKINLERVRKYYKVEILILHLSLPSALAQKRFSEILQKRQNTIF